MKRLLKIQIMIMTLIMLAGCGKDNNEFHESTQTTAQEQTEITENISDTDPAYWTLSGSDRTGYVSVPYNWTEEEYEYEFEGNYSLMLISPERNAMVSLIENNYGYDPKQYDSQEPAEYIMEAYVAQYESQGGAHMGSDTVELAGYTFYKSTDCYPAGSYADYDYYLYTYVAFTGDRFYTIVIEGELGTISEISIKVEESFSESKLQLQ